MEGVVLVEAVVVEASTGVVDVVAGVAVVADATGP